MAGCTVAYVIRRSRELRGDTQPTREDERNRIAATCYIACRSRGDARYLSRLIRSLRQARASPRTARAARTRPDSRTRALARPLSSSYTGLIATPKRAQVCLTETRQ